MPDVITNALSPISGISVLKRLLVAPSTEPYNLSMRHQYETSMGQAQLISKLFEGKVHTYHRGMNILKIDWACTFLLNLCYVIDKQVQKCSGTNVQDQLILHIQPLTLDILSRTVVLYWFSVPPSSKKSLNNLRFPLLSQ